MFPRRERLPKESFFLLPKDGRRLSSANFTAFIPRGAEGYAVVVSKKIARLSVARHRTKRRILAALRSLSSLPPALIVFPKASANSVSYQDTKKELAGLLSKNITNPTL